MSDIDINTNVTTTTSSSSRISTTRSASKQAMAARKTADTLLDSTIADSTKQQYGKKIKAMQKYFTKHNKAFTLPDYKHYDSAESDLFTNDIIEFFGSLIPESNDSKDSDVIILDENNEPILKKYPSTSSVAIYKSALIWYYHKKTSVIDPKLDIKLNNFLKGYRKTVAQKKLSGEMELVEGRHPLSFVGYKILAKKFMLLSPEFKDNVHVNTWNMSLFCWPFFILQWNLMARSASIADIMLQHISWKQDCLVFVTPKHKGDQEGVKNFPRHVYANPLCPSICPILSLAVLIFCRSFVYDFHQAGNYQLFPGQNQEARFSKRLHAVLRKLTEQEINQLGAKVSQIGTHSARKGAPTYVGSMMAGPNAIQIYLRAGWSLGTTQDRYIFAGDGGGDQFTGRVVNGLPNTNKDFCILPPHFDYLNSSDSFLKHEDWTEILPCYSKFPQCFKEVVPYLLASIVYHYDYLDTHLPHNHPLRSSFLFSSGKIFEFKPLVTISSSNIHPTGIPPYLSLSSELFNVRESIAITRSDILAAYEHLPENVANKLLTNFTIQGAVPLTQDEMKKMMKTLLDEVKKIQKDNNENKESKENNNFSGEDSKFHSFCWEGKFHMLPEGFLLPTTNIKDVWNLWYHGHAGKRIQPYRKISGHDLSIKKQKTQLSKTRSVMEYLGNLVQRHELLAPGQTLEEMDRAKSSSVFDSVYPILRQQLFLNESASSTRIADTSIATIYDHMSKCKKRKRDINPNLSVGEAAYAVNNYYNNNIQSIGYINPNRNTMSLNDNN